MDIINLNNTVCYNARKFDKKIGVGWLIIVTILPDVS
jgi:hypothetical protein